MEILKMIQKWREGCKLAKTKPVECTACTSKLIDDIELREQANLYNGCITPKFIEVIDRLKQIATTHDSDSSDQCAVNHGDLLAMLNEFIRLDFELRKLKPYMYIDPQEDHNE